MQHGVSAELLSSGSVWYVHVCDCWLAFLQERTRPHLDLSQRKSLLKHFSAVTSDICNVQDLLWKTKYYNSQNMHHTVLILWVLRSLLGNGCWHVIIIMIGLFFRGRRSFRAQTHITNITDKELDC